MLFCVKFVCLAWGLSLCEVCLVVGFWHPPSLSVFVAFINYSASRLRASRWFRQARPPLQTACGTMAKSARCCSPRLSRRFAKRAMEQWALNSQGTIAFCLHTLWKSALFFLHLLLFAHAVVISMFPVFLAWHCVLTLLSLSPLGFLDTLEAGTCAGSRACCFLFVFSFVLLNHDVPCEFWQHARKFSLRDVDVWGPCFLVILFFTTLCYLSAASLTVVDHVIETRLEALKHDYLLVLRV